MSNIIFPRRKTLDSLMTFDHQTVDSAGVFLIGELERLDPRIHEPLASVTWSRDIQLRQDVTIADEFSSFSNSSFAAAPGVAGSGKAWVGKNADAIPGISLEIGKTTTPMPLWAMQLGWTIPELHSAAQLGRPIDSQKFAAMQLKYQMDIDEQVYIGDAALGLTGLLNNAGITPVASSGKLWSDSSVTVDVILGELNALLNDAWKRSAYSICPSELRLDPVSFSALTTRLISTAGTVSVLKYISENCIANAINGRPLNIQPLKWCDKAVSGLSKTRAIAYTNDETRVRFPLVPLQRTPIEYRDLRQLTTYFGRLGAVEFVYSETVAYMDFV